MKRIRRDEDPFTCPFVGKLTFESTGKKSFVLLPYGTLIKTSSAATKLANTNTNQVCRNHETNRTQKSNNQY